MTSTVVVSYSDNLIYLAMSELLLLQSSTQKSSRAGGEGGGKEKSKTLSRREKLLQELQAIDEVIERKKSKKRHS